MTHFKSFDPKKYTKSIKYNQELRYEIKLLNKDIKNKSELCSNCGYPLGEHLRLYRTCTTVGIPKYLKPVKHEISN